MSQQLVLYERIGNTAHITLNRPEKRNALNPDMLRDLGETWRRFQSDEAAWTAIVAGAGPSFCAGSDIAYLGDREAQEMSHLAAPGVDVDKPIIAAIQGHCIAAGFYLAMNCDIRIASDNAQFAITEGRIGTTIGGVSSVTRHMPSAIAMSMLFTASPIDAQRAYEVGFLNSVVSPDQLLAEAEKVATEVNANGPMVLRAWKRLIKMGNPPSPFEQHLAWRQVISPVRDSHDAIEGRQAFLEKRRPSFEGR